MMKTPRWPEGMGGSRAFTLIELLVVIAVIGMLAALLLPLISRSKTQALNTICMGQLHQMGIATRVFADEHEGRLPRAELLPSMPINPAAPNPRICDVLGPYVGKTEPGTNSAPVFRCPCDTKGRFAAEGSSYEWNTRLNGRRIDETISRSVNFKANGSNYGEGNWQTNGTAQLRFPPVTTPLLFDYDEVHPRPPESGKNVVYMDGHVAPLQIVPLD
jgi:prepilin-type N-terminal cleavage/methylation domain-containing protein/prepilin-type processing-associated H-X9-DG protein